jgi:murein DD-endopeptidase MepM/ murein hydrolase activator NlpD
MSYLVMIRLSKLKRNRMMLVKINRSIVLVLFLTSLEAFAVERSKTKDCVSYDSEEQEKAPVQKVGELEDVGVLFNSKITTYTKRGEFEGLIHQKATHEGLDLFNDNREIVDVPVRASASGEVVYVRKGCNESGQFNRNTNIAECGAGWGNHIVIKHTRGLYTRYAHLRADSIFSLVGEKIDSGAIIGLMGNSGRSEGRHLHFEIGMINNKFNKCEPSQSFNLVFDPRNFGI